MLLTDFPQRCTLIGSLDTLFGPVVCDLGKRPSSDESAVRIFEGTAQRSECFLLCEDGTNTHTHVVFALRLGCNQPQYDIELVHNIEQYTGKPLGLCPEVQEDDVLKLLNQVAKASRVAKMRLMEQVSFLKPCPLSNERAAV